MLEDRSYIRDGIFQRVWPATVILMVVNGAVFVLQEILGFYAPASYQSLMRALALSREGLSHGHVWQLFTFQFLHGGMMHLLFNLMGIFFFGRLVEDRLGKAAFLKLYFLSGVVGGLLQGTLGLAIPVYFGAPVVGASAGVYGLIMTSALLEPHGVILLFFVLPMRMKYFVAIAGAIALFYILVPAEPGIAHAAHLGGMLGALAFMRWRSWMEAFRPVREQRQPVLRPRELLPVSGEKRSLRQRFRKNPDAEVSSAEFISREVDPILDKISQHGIHSLTPREREILEAARTKMEKRSQDR